MATCGDFGGRTEEGEPCRQEVFPDQGMGWYCEEHIPLTIDQKKAAFLHVMAQAIYSHDQAARIIGHNRSTVWRWREKDAEFDLAVKRLHYHIESQRSSMVEEAFFRRVMGEEANTADYIFYLCNRAPDRWRDAREINLNYHVPREEIATMFAELGRQIRDAIEDEAMRQRVYHIVEGVATKMKLLPPGSGEN